MSEEELKGENVYIDYHRLESDYQSLLEFLKNELEVQYYDQILQFLQYSLSRAQEDLEKLEEEEKAQNQDKADFDPNYFA